MPAAITVFTSKTLLSKRIQLNEYGGVVAEPAAQMVEGEAITVPAGTAEDLRDIIKGLTSQSAIALGVSEYPNARVVSVPRLRETAQSANGLPVVSRTREFFDYRDGPAWMLIDTDWKGCPDHIKAQVTEAGGPFRAIVKIVPGLGQAARVSRASTSAGLYRGDTGERFPGNGGEHGYILVSDATDIGRALQVLHDQCWLHGYGWHMIGAAGQLLERSLVDITVRFGERLCFEGAPVIVPPLMQDADLRAPRATGGIAVDLRRVLPALTPYERARVDEAKQAARVVLEPQAQAVRSEADRKLAEQISQKSGMPLAAALRQVQARHNGRLMPDIILHFDHLGEKTVGDVLAKPEAYIGETLGDPLEPEYGRGKAIVMRSQRDPARSFIHSFAHGRGLYDLLHDAASILRAISSAEPKHVVDVLCSLAPQADLGDDDLEELIRAASERTAIRGKPQIGMRAIARRLKTEQQGRERAANAARAQASALADQRLTRSLPPPDGELTPVVTFVDQTLSAAPGEEPPMRNLDRHLCEVHTREPWGLHLLTSKGSNAQPLEEGEHVLPPVPEPGLVELSAVQATMLVEQYIRYVTPATEKSAGYPARLQRPFIDAFMSFDKSELPVIRGIVTAPLVTYDGRALSGIGLDRDSGLFYRIDPGLLKCVPDFDGATADEIDRCIIAATRFLLDMWLVDVNTPEAGKLLLVMRSIHKIQRLLLPERPAWSVEAFKAAAGKTTVIKMMTMAVDGRLANAATWSNNEEERRKALFAYFREGVSEIIWDNMPRGTVVDCPHTARSLTTRDYSDRVLGESKTPVVDASPVTTFNGNATGFKGDMVSRAIRIEIAVDRPDPQNRSFTHPDPVGWTRQNRAKILRALYTVLIGGCLRRPASFVSKTRFHVFYDLVAWPVEYAAVLIDVTLDTAALLTADQSNDEETSSVTALISELSALYGSAEFKAKQVADVVEKGVPKYGEFTSDADRERADRLLDAFAEVLGSPLRRRSAGAIAKLLNAHVINIPVYVADHVETLKALWDAHKKARTYYVHKADKRRYSASTGVDGFAGDAGDGGDATAIARC